MRTIEEEKAIWQQRLEECKSILADLLENEFSDIKDSVHFLIRYEEGKDPDIAGYLKRDFIYKHQALVVILSSMWSKWPGLDPIYDIRSIIIRHELEHLRSGRNDDDPIFKAGCNKKDILLRFKKTEMDLPKKIISKITRALIQKIQSGELEIYDPDGSQIVEVFDDSPEPETLFEWLEFIDEEVKRQAPKVLKQVLTEIVGGIVREWQEKELNKILEAR